MIRFLNYTCNTLQLNTKWFLDCGFTSLVVDDFNSFSNSKGLKKWFNQKLSWVITLQEHQSGVKKLAILDLFFLAFWNSFVFTECNCILQLLFLRN